MQRPTKSAGKQMHNDKFGVLAGLAGMVSLAALSAPAAAQVENANVDAKLDGADAAASGSAAIIVTRTRQQAQTQFTALSPVDVFSSKTIQSTVTNNVDETLAQLVPSFNV